MRRWQPSPLLRGSAVLHAVAAGSLTIAPAAWPYALGAVAANHLLLTAAGLWPRSHLLGQNLTRLAETADAIALTIDDGPDPQITPQVLDALDAAGARASFFCIGARAERHPQLIAEIVRRGHRVENHSQHHRHHFSLCGPRALSREIAAAQATLSALAGTPPQYFRAPAGLRNPFLDPVLHRHDLHLASWTRRGFDTRERDPARVGARLLRGLAAGDVLLLHDGHAARSHSGEPMILAVLPQLFAACRARGLRVQPLPPPDWSDPR